ncbi:MAG: FKBP-type peptidyl-prolyl cis-trans isomerase [Planctomycetota bacterium]
MLSRNSSRPVLAWASLAVLASSSLFMSHHAMGQSAEISKDPVAYYLGLNIGGSMAQQGFREGDFDSSLFVAGLMDALGKRDPQLSPEQIRETEGKLQALMQKRNEEMKAERERAAEMNKEKGAVWLEKNGKEKGVKTLPSGVQMKTITEGEGASPTPEDRVQVHYTGKLTDGTVFDSSVARGEPATFMLKQVIKGWQIALQEMKVGGKSMVYIPSELAYGFRGSPPVIGPNEVLVFEVELLEIP